MKIHYYPFSNQVNDLVLTIGTFDGVHRGHMTLLESIKQIASSAGGQSGLLTFHPHPRLILNPESSTRIYLLNTIEERIDRLRQAGIDHLYVMPFSVDFANMNAEQYVRDFLVNEIGFSHLVIGHDHRFGKGRSGDYALLENLSSEFNYELQQIEKQQLDNITFSSTAIRQRLLAGKVQEANEILGYAYEVQGVVVHGEQRGRTMNFPTANIEPLNMHKLIPETGVYVSKTVVNDKEYAGMLNIGTRPTFDGTHKTIENHLFGFDGDLYGCHLRVKFLKKLRDEQKFDSKMQLQEQLVEDREMALGWLGNG